AGATIYECEIDDMEYNVELSNGVDLEFNRNGKLVKIEADHGVIAQSVLKAILPAKALQHLTAQGLADRVDDVEFRRNSIVVDINNSNDHEIRFNLDGSLKGRR
ncbi:MAG: PepSY-like domain-containing protein, partial [Muribaculaceae bacterium]|nr:PepSY-like domain-containing protein [Muribaculaceae bacterium]